ncbi:LacI family DNA-binding transcriptional regulator [Paenibacillus filicis]|uniref:LacI family DNA-binding transcriptional regulator n=1 Tax=Paenibacillus gyeongsangnamensis TaxID=3388067 RepID=A0ABT4Q4Q0_9BACL|nr:LacI family DNA-binding transcriptional regulator [Paenibacillus filicis]MCZ8511853.1 LacI family DNA-binding transcriptional regulator [Paenibacillus filicis]
MSKRIRQEDIAKELGLSINTVSLALKNSSRINEETRSKVQQVAKALNYIPNSIARSLVQKKTDVIGFILPKMTNPVQIETAQQMERKLLTSGYNMMLMTTDSDKNYESQALDILLSRQVDGIFLFPTNKHNQDKIKSIRSAGIPLVLLSGGRYKPSSDAVYMNQFSGAYQATEHLAKLGYREIGFITGGAANVEKFDGYQAVLRDRQLEFREELVARVSHFSYEQGYKAASKLMANGPVRAVLASSDYLALGALRWCRERGLRVPEDVALIGFDDLEAAEYAEVPLTSVTYKGEELTTKAVSLMFRLIEEQERMTSKEPECIEINPTLSIRKSCGAI